MPIFYLKGHLHSLFLCLNIYFLLVFCQNVIFYSIENANIDIDYVENGKIDSFKFEIKSIYILNTFKSVYLLQNQYLKCVYINNSYKYYIPNIVEIPGHENIILNFSALDDEQDNVLTSKIFMGQISYKFLLRFIKYSTEEDAFINALSFMEFINILTVLEILGFKRTKNNNTFLKHLLVSSIMSKNFDFHLSDMFLKLPNSDYDRFQLNLEYLFSVFLKFVFIDKISNYTFLYFKNNSSSKDPLKNLSYRGYIRYKERLGNDNIIFLESHICSHLEKLLKYSWIKNSIICFIRHCNVDLYLIAMKMGKLKPMISNFIDLIKPDSLKKLIITDNVINKPTLKVLIHYGYFPITKFVKIICDLDIEEIHLVLRHSQNIKRLIIESKEACYNIFFELKKHAIIHKNLNIKYKCNILIMQCQMNDIFQNLPQNLSFFIRKFHISFTHCEFCMMKSLTFFRKVLIKYNTKKKLKKYKNQFYNCINTKEVYISTKQNKPEKIHRKIFKYIFRMEKLESILLENIIIPEILIWHILESKNLISIKLYNSCIPTHFSHDYSILNYILRSITIKESKYTLNDNFFKFLLLFRNLTFLKLYIKDIDSDFEMRNKHCTSRIINTPNENLIVKLEYLKVNIKEETIIDWSILFAFSNFFDISNLNILILQMHELNEKDAFIISNLRSLKEICLSIYRQKTEIMLKRLTKILENKFIKRIRLDICNLNNYMFEYIYNFKNFDMVFIHFQYFEAYDLNSLHRIRCNYPNSVIFLYEFNRLVSSEVKCFLKEHNIG
ncbi:hypothetical protein CWI36_1356p0010 [Hamiltosporidium magnivora]|uniref:Uncharacterized protein n=1 Tax=Hamiltosporidium magnivora TaxID=148818 RepID=A0A4Q9L1V8_9MICR|nr:hypothetical protein CWI36_1356p0010 [Hamiltosporidium magnivora]